MRIGVYGLGRFGSFWAGSLATTHNDVVAYSRSRHSLPEGVRSGSEEEVLTSDLLFYCVAISSFEEVLASTASKIGPDTIVMDTCSVKKYPMEWMKRHLSPSQYLMGTHPMFGPDSAKNGMKGLPLVMCAMGEKDQIYEKVKKLFLDMDLRVIEITAD